MSENLKLYYSPMTRASGVRTLLEELDAPYDLEVLNLLAGETHSEAYLKVNPLGKVPAVSHRGQVITEQVAIYLYIGDLFAEAGLTPAMDDPLRGAYLRWMVMSAASFEPALIDKAMKREPAPRSMSVYGDYDQLMALLQKQLAKGPYLLGERFTVADVLWGTALTWTMHFELVPPFEEFKAYIERINARPAFQRVQKWDLEMQEEHKKAVGATDE